MRAEKHPRQSERLAALRSLDILDTPREQRFDSIVELAAEICGAPIAVINLIDEHRQWFKAEIGLGVRETPLDTSLCSHAILRPGLTVIPDTLADNRMRDNPLCSGDPHLRFYAGALLETDDGLPIGTLCVLDHRPRDLTDQQRRALATLADQVMAQIKLARELQKTKELSAEVDHRVKNSLSLVQALLTFQARQTDDDGLKQTLNLARDRISSIAQVHDLLHRSETLTDIDIGELAERLVALLSSQAPGHVTISASVPSIRVKGREGINIGILLNELVTNALRHALSDERPGQIRVSGEVRDDRLHLSVEDNGKGLPSGFDPQRASGLGMRLALTLAREIGGELRWRRRSQGAVFTFDVPLLP